MSAKLQPGMTLPDFELPDENGDLHRLSELQGDDPMILLLGRGEHCPRERQHQKELIKLYEWCAVGFTKHGDDPAQRPARHLQAEDLNSGATGPISATSSSRSSARSGSTSTPTPTTTPPSHTRWCSRPAW